MSDTIRLHRCHWCANEGCPTHGLRRVVEGGCVDHIFLPPELRPRKFEGKRRIKKITSVGFEWENVGFVEDHILPRNEKMFMGHFSRGVNACMKRRLNRIGAEFPVIEKIRGDYCRVKKKISLDPEVIARLDEIREHWKDTSHEVSRADIINFFLIETREEMGLLEKRGV